MPIIRELQNQHKEWQQKNFGDIPAHESLIGMMEELGELSHAHLKETQEYRTGEDHQVKAKDAIGDIFIFMMSYCSARNWDLFNIIINTWDEVKQRDWVKYPQNGRDK